MGAVAPLPLVARTPRAARELISILIDAASRVTAQPTRSMRMSLGVAGPARGRAVKRPRNPLPVSLCPWSGEEELTAARGHRARATEPSLSHPDYSAGDAAIRAGSRATRDVTLTARRSACHVTTVTSSWERNGRFTDSRTKNIDHR